VKKTIANPNKSDVNDGLDKFLCNDDSDSDNSSEDDGFGDKFAMNKGFAEG
jgi:hypothetical protein